MERQRQFGDTILRAAFSAASLAQSRRGLTVLIFHRVLPAPDPLFPHEVHAAQFDDILRWLRGWFDVIPLEDAVARLKSSNLPSRAASVTFDDGYEDNYSVALPLLLKHKLSATFFISTGYLNGGLMWNDTIIESVRATHLPCINLDGIGLGSLRTQTLADKQISVSTLIDTLKYCEAKERAEKTIAVREACSAPIPKRLMLNENELLELHSANMGIGAHTVSHPILARCTDKQAVAEIAESRDYLEGRIGRPVRLFAYPNGKPGKDYGPRDVDIVKRLNFDAAVSTTAGISRIGDDPFQIRRFTPWDRTRLRFGARLLGNIAGAYNCDEPNPDSARASP